MWVMMSYDDLCGDVIFTNVWRSFVWQTVRMMMEKTDGDTTKELAAFAQREAPCEVTVVNLEQPDGDILLMSLFLKVEFSNPWLPHPLCTKKRELYICRRVFKSARALKDKKDFCLGKGTSLKFWRVVAYCVCVWYLNVRCQMVCGFKGWFPGAWLSLINFPKNLFFFTWRKSCMKTLISFSCFFVFLFVCLFLKPRFGLVYNDKANVLSDETSDLKSHRCEWKPLTSWSPQQCQNFYYCYIRVVTKGEAQFLKLLRVKKNKPLGRHSPDLKKKKKEKRKDWMENAHLSR